MTCPCCSEKLYEECCKPYHENKNAPTAKALMCSRFSAFALPNAEYLMETTLPEKRKLHNKKDLQEWGEINNWIKLEIVSTPSRNQVEFKAFYHDENGKPQLHHELSLFEKMDNRWYYVSGEFIG